MEPVAVKQFFNVSPPPLHIQQDTKLLQDILLEINSLPCGKVSSARYQGDWTWQVSSHTVYLVRKIKFLVAHYAYGSSGCFVTDGELTALLGSAGKQNRSCYFFLKPNRFQKSLEKAVHISHHQKYSFVFMKCVFYFLNVCFGSLFSPWQQRVLLSKNKKC